jgi:hypothetical protein
MAVTANIANSFFIVLKFSLGKKITPYSQGCAGVKLNVHFLFYILCRWLCQMATLFFHTALR